MNEKLSEFIGYLSVRRSQNTVVAYRTDLTKFIDYLKANSIYSLSEVNSGHIDKFITSLGLSRPSLTRKMAAISTLYQWLKRQKIVLSNPVEDVDTIKTVRNQPDFLLLEEIRLLRHHASKDMKVVIEFLLSTGVRVSELCYLSIRDVDFEKREVRVIGKGDKQRIVPFSRACSELLSAYIADRNGALFIRKNGRRVTPNSVYFQIRKLGEEVLGRRIHPHLFRHTFATMLIDEGLSIVEVQTLLGHASVATTSIYTHPTERIKERYDTAIDKIM